MLGKWNIDATSSEHKIILRGSVNRFSHPRFISRNIKPFKSAVLEKYLVLRNPLLLGALNCAKESLISLVICLALYIFLADTTMRITLSNPTFTFLVSINLTCSSISGVVRVEPVFASRFSVNFSFSAPDTRSFNQVPIHVNIFSLLKKDFVSFPKNKS